MTPEPRQHIKALLHSALERDPAERSAFLDEACAADRSLQSEVQVLITSAEQALGFIESPPVEAWRVRERTIKQNQWLAKPSITI